MTRVLFHVQHLLGTGHLRRAAAIATALAREGFDVTLVSGGMPLPVLALDGVTLVQLPPLRAADESFRVLVDADGKPIDDAWKAARRAALLAQLDAMKPDVVITELFPLGRRSLSFELVALIEAARALQPCPLILASVRDVLAAKRDERKLDEMVWRTRAWYDRVLVHGDPALIPLAASFPEHRIADKVVYTGYVATASDTVADATGDGENEIVVSVGGGAVGALVLRAALAARPLVADPRRWRLLMGGDLDPATRAELLRQAAPDCLIEPARPDFPALLARCHVSVSQAGYNTVMDVLTARARAVFVPFAMANETEQTLRAEALAGRGWAQIVAESALSPARLAAAVDRAAASPRPDASSLRRNGATETARLVRRWINERGLPA